MSLITPLKKQILHYQLLDNWFYSPQGLWAGKCFIEAISAFRSQFIGNNLLQIGQCGTNSWLNLFDYTQKWIASPYSTNQPRHIITHLTQLPLARNSLDCIIAPFTMESFTQVAAILDEFDRVLKPMGYLIILGFNPLSMWGLGSKCGLISGFAPKMLYLHSSFRLNRACMARGFQQSQLLNFGYIPPVQSQTCINNLFFLDEIGKMIWPFPANFYCYIAQKYEPGYPLQPYFAETQMEGYSHLT